MILETVEVSLSVDFFMILLKEIVWQLNEINK